MDPSTSELRQKLDHVETELSIEKEKYQLLKQELVSSYKGSGQSRTPDDDDKKLLHAHIAELQVMQFYIIYYYPSNTCMHELKHGHKTYDNYYYKNMQVPMKSSMSVFTKKSTLSCLLIAFSYFQSN